MNRGLVGGLAWLSIVQYFVVEELVRQGWSLPYSRQSNYISDLGAVGCGTYEGRTVCSPDHVWMNVSFALVGVAIMIGAVLARSGARSPLTPLVVGLYVAAGAGSVLVGLFPEDTNGALHGLGAALFFLAASLGHILLGLRLRRTTAGSAYGTALAIVGVIGLVGTVLLGSATDLGFGAGLVERVVVYGADLGFIATGLLMIRGRDPTARD